MPLETSRFTYALTAFWYVVPPNCACTGETPSQDCSLRGTRTVRIFQVRIALMDVWSIGPSQMPLPWMQANSPPERFTPSSRYAAPEDVRIRLPDTCSAGAAPDGGGVVTGGVVAGGVVAGGGVTGGVVGGLVVVAGVGDLATGRGLCRSGQQDGGSAGRGQGERERPGLGFPR